jgi:hypothetical protein
MQQPTTDSYRPDPCPLKPLTRERPGLDAFQMMEGGLHPLRVTPDDEAPEQTPARKNAPLVIYEMVVCVPAHDAV